MRNETQCFQIVSYSSFSICPCKELKLLGFFKYLLGSGDFPPCLYCRLLTTGYFPFHSYQSCFLRGFFPNGMGLDFLYTCF